MDQVKVILHWLKVQHFWVLTVLAVCIALGAWYQGSSQLQTEIKDNKQKIQTQFSNASTIKNRPFHPNTDVNQVQAAENRELAAKVRATWQALYDRQVSEVLKWPPQLSAEFSQEVSKLKFGEEILPLMRERYLNYIQRRFPELPKIVKAIELPADGSRGRGGRGGRGGFGGEFGGFGGEMGGFGGGGARAGLTDEQLAGQDFLVQWHDQANVRDQLAWDKRPSSIAIWVTQEDLWVYETLLEAIARTNTAARADRYSNAAVRDIWAMQVGRAANRQAASTTGRIFIPEEAGGGLGGEAGFGGRGGEFGGEFGGEAGEFGGGRGGEFGGEGGGFGGEGGEALDEKSLLLAGRYVDATGAPMASAEDGEFKFGTEYKLLPVRLVLKLDQRWLNQLLIELANAPLQVEVKEVRINPESGNEFGGGARRRGRGGFGGGGDQEVQAFDREPQVREQVVIEGLVYIFYPPDETVLQVTSDSDNLAATGF